MKLIGIQTSESHNHHPVTLILPVRSLFQRPPLASLLCLCPVPHLAAHAQTSTSTSGTNSSTSTSETSSESSSQPSLNASSPETTSTSASSSRSTSPELLEMERSFNSLLAGMTEKQGHTVTRRQMGDLREQQQRITVLKQVAMQLQNQPRPVSAPPAASMPLPPYPRRCPCDKGVYETGAGRECLCSP